LLPKREIPTALQNKVCNHWGTYGYCSFSPVRAPKGADHASRFEHDLDALVFFVSKHSINPILIQETWCHQSGSNKSFGWTGRSSRRFRPVWRISAL